MPQNLDSVGFKYQIGDVLIHKALNWLQTKTSAQTFVQIVVLERLAQECPGGVQLHYNCRIVGPDGQLCSDKCLHEHELMPLPTE